MSVYSIFSLNLKNFRMQKFWLKKFLISFKNKFSLAWTMSNSKFIINCSYREEAPFPLRYLHACTLFELKNVKDSLRILYKMLRE
jgi:hypothetical protein